MIGQTISHYKILEKLGKGGMGTVYKAQDLNLDRLVAIKFLSRQLSASEQGKTRFTQEAKAAAALNNPNILSVYDIGEQDGMLFFVMEYVEGKTLKAHISDLWGSRGKAGEGISVKQALEWMGQIGNGLKAAHARDIIHRDIKPENVMVTKDGILKIMDFGIAKLKGNTGLTKTGVSLGTLAYMSPEQTQGIVTDHRTDIWSLGVVLYELLTGEVPFKAEHEAALLYMIASEEPVAPSALHKKIPHQVDSLVERMLEKNRDRRFQKMDEVLSALEAVKTEVE